MSRPAGSPMPAGRRSPVVGEPPPGGRDSVGGSHPVRGGHRAGDRPPAGGGDSAGRRVRAERGPSGAGRRSADSGPLPGGRDSVVGSLPTGRGLSAGRWLRPAGPFAALSAVTGLSLATVVAASTAGAAAPPQPAAAAQSAGLEADPAVMRGGHEPDDGIALALAVASREMGVAGTSVVFGKAPLERGVPISRDLDARFGPPGVEVHPGAASATPELPAVPFAAAPGVSAGGAASDRAQKAASRPVWLDVDPAVMRGGHEPDDGIAMALAFASPEVRVGGVSVVFGNAPFERGVPISRDLDARFGPPGLEVHLGAAPASPELPAAPLRFAAAPGVSAGGAASDRAQDADARPVWLDVDPAVMRGGHEPDDGVAMALAFASPEVRVAGVSVVFGNAPLERGVPIARNLVSRFGPPGLEVPLGAAPASPELPEAPLRFAAAPGVSAGGAASDRAQDADARPVWLDVDPAVMRGGHEPDDGVAMALAFASPEVRVAGVSVVFGNAPFERGFPIARNLVSRFGPPGLEVPRGAAPASPELPAAPLRFAAAPGVSAGGAASDRAQDADARPVWLDVDPAVMRGGHEPDDGIALALAFASPEVRVVGVSVVFGNAPLERGFPIARSLVSRFGPPGLEVHRGAASPSLEPTPASGALVRALEREPLSVAVLGPATNLAAALTERPDLAPRLERVVAVIGQRGDEALTFPGDPTPLPDFNFELDPAAAEVVLASGAPIVLVPFEFAVELPVTAADWAGVWDTPFGEVFRGPVEDYLDWFEEHTGRRVTYPFDSFALTWLLAPDLLRCGPARVAVRRGSADRAPGLVRLRPAAGESAPEEHAVTWCHEPMPGLKPFLLRRLAGR